MADPGTKDVEEGRITATSRNIAYGLLFFYGFCLLVTLGAAIYFFYIGKDTDGKWIGIFKDGFVFLGGSLATIIGYYFGNRGVRAAEERAAEALEKAKVAQEKTQTIKEELVRPEVEMKDDRISTETPPVITESGLDEPSNEGEINP